MKEDTNVWAEGAEGGVAQHPALVFGRVTVDCGLNMEDSDG